MFRKVHIERALFAAKQRVADGEEQAVSEARRILHNDLFTHSKILQNLGRYEKRNEKLDEEGLNASHLFTRDELKATATRHRLKLLPGNLYKPGIPYEALMRVESLNGMQKKDLKHFFILSYPRAFESSIGNEAAVLFALTNDDNYYLIHHWGNPVPWFRQVLYWPLRSFETLLATVITFTLLLTLVLPTALITLDSKATYWSGYRAAAFFHLLIFNAGVTTYITLTFTRNFSSSVWNRKKDFD